jgi:hypothetical protein
VEAKQNVYKSDFLIHQIKTVMPKIQELGISNESILDSLKDIKNGTDGEGRLVEHL